jgi:hypothetical protein
MESNNNPLAGVFNLTPEVLAVRFRRVLNYTIV